jgi:hypothetical protein
MEPIIHRWIALFESNGELMKVFAVNRDHPEFKIPEQSGPPAFHTSNPELSELGMPVRSFTRAIYRAEAGLTTVDGETHHFIVDAFTEGVLDAFSWLKVETWMDTHGANLVEFESHRVLMGWPNGQ